ncbi:MAG: hypothetical protein IPK50_15120 [Fibrobacterota bacterium]|nr:hypothetical protein [Fibrobacterota bacterium]QQS03624.1 MAG: hypothetical protein IPK50_15120 [Fibrobacterota bacterium]
MSPTKLLSIVSATLVGLSSCDSGAGTSTSGPSSPSTRDTTSIEKNNGLPDTSSKPRTDGKTDSAFVGRWRIYAISADTVEFQNNGKGKFIVDLGFRVAVDSFLWSAAGGSIHFTHADGKTEDGTYRFFGKDSFNMTLPSLSTQLYLRLK